MISHTIQAVVRIEAPKPAASRSRDRLAVRTVFKLRSNICNQRRLAEFSFKAITPGDYQLVTFAHYCVQKSTDNFVNCVKFHNL